MAYTFNPFTGTFDNVGSSSGGAQTPWTSNINGAGFTLTNVSALTINNSANDSIVFSTPSNDPVQQFKIAGTTKATLQYNTSITGLSLRNDVSNQDLRILDSGLSQFSGSLTVAGTVTASSGLVASNGMDVHNLVQLHGNSLYMNNSSGPFAGGTIYMSTGQIFMGTTVSSFSPTGVGGTFLHMEGGNIDGVNLFSALGIATDELQGTTDSVGYLFYGDGTGSLTLGDFNSAYGGQTIIIDQSSGVAVNGPISLASDIINGNIQTLSGTVTIGDVDHNADGTVITVDNIGDNVVISDPTVYPSGFFNVSPTGSTASIGDIFGNGQNTFMQVVDNAAIINFNAFAGYNFNGGAAFFNALTVNNDWALGGSAGGFFGNSGISQQSGDIGAGLVALGLFSSVNSVGNVLATVTGVNSKSSGNFNFLGGSVPGGKTAVVTGAYVYATAQSGTITTGMIMSVGNSPGTGNILASQSTGITALNSAYSFVASGSTLATASGGSIYYNITSGATGTGTQTVTLLLLGYLL